MLTPCGKRLPSTKIDFSFSKPFRQLKLLHWQDLRERFCFSYNLSFLYDCFLLIDGAFGVIFERRPIFQGFPCDAFTCCVLICCILIGAFVVF